MGRASRLSWSYSRSRSLRGCLRAHWFSKYPRGEPEEEQAKLLGNLASLDMLAGQVVDMQVGAAIDRLRDGEQLQPDLPSRALETWTRMLNSSSREAELIRAGKPLSMGAQPLLQDYYFGDRDLDALARSGDRVYRSMCGLEASEVFQRLRSIPRDKWMPEKEPWAINAVDWELDGVQVWSNLDFWLDYGGRGMVIIDWKSSSFVDQNEALQLATYSLYGQVTRQLPRDKVLVQAVHLPDAPEWDAKPISEIECDSVRSFIVEEHSFEKGLLDEVKLPDGTAEFWAPRERFPARPLVQACLGCRFREICPDGQTVAPLDRPAPR